MMRLRAACGVWQAGGACEVESVRNAGRVCVVDTGSRAVVGCGAAGPQGAIEHVGKAGGRTGARSQGGVQQTVQRAADIHVAKGADRAREQRCVAGHCAIAGKRGVGALAAQVLGGGGVGGGVGHRLVTWPGVRQLLRGRVLGAGRCIRGRHVVGVRKQGEGGIVGVLGAVAGAAAWEQRRRW